MDETKKTLTLKQNTKPFALVVHLQAYHFVETSGKSITLFLFNTTNNNNTTATR